MKDHNLSVSEVESIEISDIQQQKTDRSECVDVKAVSPQSFSKSTTTDRLAKLLSSTASVPKVNITFEDVTFTVKTGISLDWSCKRGRKCILDRVSGEFVSGELTGIIGASGAGKSTLLDILSGYTTCNVQGSVKINGGPRDMDQFRRQSCYILQDSELQPLLRVKEAMMFASHLKLGSMLTHKVKEERVTLILNELDLISSEDKLTGKLSGGEKKRLAIALEIVNNPPIMLFDEPTSGLDSSMARNCLSVLKGLAKKGRTVICTIHQPSALLLEMFDHLYIIASGRCIYQGDTNNLIPFLLDLDLVCPVYHNPADFVLEVSTKEDVIFTKELLEVSSKEDIIEKLATKVDNGKNHAWRRQHDLKFSLASQMEKDSELTLVSGGGGEEDKAKILQKEEETVYSSTPFYSQLYYLLKRNIIKLSRDKFLSQARVFLHILIGTLIGSFYCGIGADAAYVFDNFSLLFFSLMFTMFTALSSMLITFPLEMPIVIREYFNGWYSLLAYYVANTISDIPIQILCTTCYCVIVYFISSQPLETFRFLLFLAMCTIVSLVAQAMGVLCGCCMKIQNGVIFGPLTVLPWVIFSGFFLHLADAPVWLQWLFHLSFLKYGLEGLMMAVYGYNRPNIPCSDDYCHFISPNKFLQELDMEKAEYWTDFSVLFSLFVIIKIITYFVLRYQLCHKH